VGDADANVVNENSRASADAATTVNLTPPETPNRPAIFRATIRDAPS
jgi:hypothetical protein